MDPTNAAAVVMFSSSMKSRNNKSFGSVENLKYVAACFPPKQSFVLSWNTTADFWGLVYFVSVTESHMLRLILSHSSDLSSINNLKKVRIKHLVELWGFEPTGIIFSPFTSLR